jgi:hypothetical protein
MTPVVKAFGRRPSERGADSYDGPASETLHQTGPQPGDPERMAISRERLPTGRGIFGSHARSFKSTSHLSAESASAGWDSLAEWAQCPVSSRSFCDRVAGF